jgi:hypothetical protein
MTLKGMYNTEYERAEGRALYVLAKKEYGSINMMASAFHVSRQLIQQFITKKVPVTYASYLGRRHNFSPGIVAYRDYVLGTLDTVDYKKLFSEQNYYDRNDIEYILEGEYVVSASQYLKACDKELL